MIDIFNIIINFLTTSKTYKYALKKNNGYIISILYVKLCKNV